MVTILKCDRCGKVIGDGEGASTLSLDVECAILDTEDGEWRVKSGLEEMDLCEECTVKAHGWMHGKGDNEHGA